MKKILLVISLLFIPTFVFATSGTCSNHGGVNCAAGASASGSVVCNDSFIDTNFSYANTEECNVNAQGCTPDEYQSLLQKDGVNDKTAQLNSVTTQTNSIVGQMNAIYGQLQTLLDKINSVQSDTQAEISASGGMVSQAQFNAEVRSKLNSFSSQKDSLNSQLLQLKNQNSQLKSSGDQLLSEINLTLSKVKDDCHNLGLTKKVPQPQPVSPPITTNTNPTEDTNPLDHCIAVWGAHTHPSSDTSNAFTKVSGCACDGGYVWTHYADATIDKCVAIVKQNSTVKSSTTGTTTSLVTGTTTSTDTKIPITPSKYKHWYDWLNPFNWFI